MVSVHEEFVQDLETLPFSTRYLPASTHERLTDATLHCGNIGGVLQVGKVCETLLPRVGSLVYDALK
jgi:hypothetical protein